MIVRSPNFYCLFLMTIKHVWLKWWIDSYDFYISLNSIANFLAISMIIFFFLKVGFFYILIDF